MKHRPFLLTLTILCVVSLPQAQNKARIANPAIGRNQSCRDFPKRARAKRTRSWMLLKIPVEAST